MANVLLQKEKCILHATSGLNSYRRGVRYKKSPLEFLGVNDTTGVALFLTYRNFSINEAIL